ncbi:MAG TPA: hypothetical protein VGG57_01140 [Stellaceae bacterium]|jgi:hypothetical protein
MFAVASLVLSVAYWLLAGRLSGDEISLGICGGVLAALWAVALSRTADIRFRFEWKAVVTVLEAVATVPAAAARVTCLLVRSGRHRPRGSVVQQPFEHARDHSAAEATRRSAVLLGISLAPDRFALLHDGDRLTVHRLAAGPPGGDERWPN